MLSRKKTDEMYARAIACAQRRGYSDIAYDFAGWIAIKWLEGKAQHQTLNQALIDFLRKEYGSLGGRCGADALLRARRTKENTAQTEDYSHEQFIEGMQNEYSRLEGSDEGLTYDHSYDIDPTRFLDAKNESIWYKYTKLELTLAEIGFDLGLSSSCVKKKLSKIKKDIFHFEGLRKMRELIEDGASALTIDWIVL